MKALKILLYVVGGLLAFWMLLAVFAKKDYRIERVAEIDAPRDTVLRQVRFFKNLKNWSPWHVYDPNLKADISGTDGEPGAKYTWLGNKKMGKGYQLIKSVAPNRIDLDVDWGWGVSPVFFVLEELPENKTKVTWNMNMHVAFPWNGLAMLTDVNAFVGEDFENGLANLKKVCEQLAHPKYRGYEVAEEEIAPRYYLGIREEIDTADISAYIKENLPKLLQLAADEKLNLVDTFYSGLYWTWGARTDMAIAIPVPENVKLDSAQTFPVTGKALMIEYFGPVSQAAEAHRAMEDYMAEKKLRNVPPVIEDYMTDVSDEPDTFKWLTKIIYFVEPKPDSTEMK
jgi:hypothetical protein